jgi:hypothetical protein
MPKGNAVRAPTLAMWIVAALLIVAVIAAMRVPAWGQSGNHGDGHAEMRPRYEKWIDKRGFGCCDNRDCRPTRAYVGEDGQWRAIADGIWHVVPPDTVLHIPSPDGRSHICMTPGAQEPRCFVPGEPRS